MSGFALAPGVVAARRRARRFERRVALATVIGPPLGGGVALALLIWGAALPPVVVALTAGFYVLTVLGVTVGFHRLYSHRAFATGRAVRAALGIAGSMSAQGPLLFWVATHRRHHAHSDQQGDPHSPQVRAGRPGGALRGLWFAHIGWMFDHEPEDWSRHARDVLRDPTAFWVTRWYLGWVLLGIALPAVLAGLAERSFQAAAMGALWAGLVRMFLVHHATWSVNSLCHVLGGRPFATRDHSRNNAMVALLTFGEGWHNNHHAFPRSARHGLLSWQPDPSYWLIRLLERIGLVHQVRRPTAAAVRSQQQRGNTATGAPS